MGTGMGRKAAESDAESPRRTPPTAAHLAGLTRFERASWSAADWFVQNLEGYSTTYNLVTMGAMIWSCSSKRLSIFGRENIAHLNKRSRILLVANHRSFFDFFMVSFVLYYKTNLPKRILFPTRAEFFYDHPLGPLVNLSMSAMRMFPPVMRDKKKARFNHYALERCTEELAIPGTVLGVHPEGRRNKGPDPYDLLPAQPGVGKMALETDAEVIPIYVHGISNDLGREFMKNWLSPKSSPVDVVFGPSVDLSDLRQKVKNARAQKEAADRCLEAIRACAHFHRDHVAASRSAANGGATA